MPRAIYIWTVIRLGQAPAAFTVKHELVAWVIRECQPVQDGLTIWRCQDGTYKSRAPVDVTRDILAEAGLA